MKLWLDDVRLPPAGWEWAKTADEAIALLSTGEVIEASLDHDIAWEPGGRPTDDEDWATTRTGLAVVLWMEANHAWPLDGVSIHSSNKEGRARMQAVIDRSDHS